MHITLHTRMLLAKTMLLRESQRSLVEKMKLGRSHIRSKRLKILWLREALLGKASRSTLRMEGNSTPGKEADPKQS